MKIKRNDPCTCGSGKKFKKCCGFERTISNFDDDYPIQFFGRLSPSSVPVCMVSNITVMNKSSIESDHNAEYPLGSWFVSFGGCGNIEISEALTRPEDGFDIAKERLETKNIVFTQY